MGFESTLREVTEGDSARFTLALNNLPQTGSLGTSLFVTVDYVNTMDSNTGKC